MKMKYPEKELLPGLNRVKANLFVNFLVQYHLRYSCANPEAQTMFPEGNYLIALPFYAHFVERIVSLHTLLINESKAGAGTVHESQITSKGNTSLKIKSPIFLINHKQECFLKHMQLMREKGDHSGNSDCDLLDAKHNISFIFQI